MLLTGDSEREMQKEFYIGKQLNNLVAQEAYSTTALALLFVLLNSLQDLPVSLEQPSMRNVHQI